MGGFRWTRGEKPDPDDHVCWYIKAQTCLCQAVCRTLFPNTGCFTLCLLLQTEGAQKRSRSTGADRSTFRPRTDLKQPDKVLALFSTLIHGPPILICLSKVCFFFSLSPHSNPYHEALNIQMLQCQWSELWCSGSTTHAHCGAPTEKQVQVRVMS